MNKRTMLIVLSWILCVGTVLGVLMQRQELVAMRAQQEQIARNLARTSQGSELGVDNGSGANNTASLAETDSHELLQLRSEITKLTARKRELAAVPAEAEQLRAQLAGSQTNSQGGIRVPPGYLRMSEAQFVGYSTPENTVQSFLWALQHHDITNLLQALAPDDARGLSEKNFFKSRDLPPGMVVQNRQNLPDGSVELQVEFVPGMPTEKLHLRAFNGEWKLEGRF
jgi:hypothetical protein